MSVETPPDVSRSSGPPALIWWVIWSAIIAGLVVIYIFLGRRSGALPPPDGGAVLDYLPVAPLVLSSLHRWLLFPRVPGAAAFPAFIVGLALAEACGIMGIFLSRYGTELFALSVLGLLQWVPIFVGKEGAATRDDAHGLRG